MPSKPLDQYLKRHAEPEALAADALDGEFGHALVVPAYGEVESLFATLGSVPKGSRGPTLVVVVLNARADSPPPVHDANAAARGRLEAEASSAIALGSGHAVALAYPNGTLLLVDRAAPGRYFPDGQGVGLARKIGADLVLRLHAAGRIASPWIHGTDADAWLPNDYFDQTEALASPGLAAAVYAYEHRFRDGDARDGGDPVLAEAGRVYEISLRYRTLGLAWSGSPYAYEAMGSAVAVRPEAYAAVRGWPRKNAGEDFYLLDKLAKLGGISRLAGTPVRIEARLSDRVPFGTGAALTRLVARPGALAGYRLDHPAAFAHLAAWLRVLAAVARGGGQLDAALAELPGDSPFFRTQLLLDALEKLGAFGAMREAVARSSDAPTMLRHFHTWFDAFRTQKLLRALGQGGLPPMTWREALAEAPFTGLTASTVDEPEPLRRMLAQEEASLAKTPAGVTALTADTDG